MFTLFKIFFYLKPELIEIHVGLSELVGKTQMALFDIVNVLLQEFKGCCSYVISFKIIKINSIQFEHNLFSD